MSYLKKWFHNFKTPRYKIITYILLFSYKMVKEYIINLIKKIAINLKVIIVRIITSFTTS